MRTIPILATFLMLAPLVLGTTDAAQPLPIRIGAIDSSAPSADAPDVTPPANIVDHEPNNDCGSAYPWPVATSGISGGSIGGGDNADWSSVKLLKTETLTAKTSGATLVEAARPGCGGTSLPTVTADADQAHFLKATSLAGSSTPYTVEYTITPNDAGTQLDVGGTAVAALTTTVIVGAEPAPIEGGLPKREGIADEDWYRVEVVAPVTDLQQVELPIALVTASFTATCQYGAPGTIQMIGEDGVISATRPEGSCGSEIRQSCIAFGGSKVYVRTVAGSPDDRLDVNWKVAGTSYQLRVSASPLQFASIRYEDVVSFQEKVMAGQLEEAAASLSTLVGTSTFHPSTPWCNPLAPVLMPTALDAWAELMSQLP